MCALKINYGNVCVREREREIKEHAHGETKVAGPSVMQKQARYQHLCFHTHIHTQTHTNTHHLRGRSSQNNLKYSPTPAATHTLTDYVIEVMSS